MKPNDLRSIAQRMLAKELTPTYRVRKIQKEITNVNYENWDRLIVTLRPKWVKKWILAMMAVGEYVLCGTNCNKFIENESEFSWEHEMPKSCGGRYKLYNLHPAHKKCNHDRGVDPIKFSPYTWSRTLNDPITYCPVVPKSKPAKPSQSYRRRVSYNPDTMGIIGGRKRAKTY